MLRRGRLRRSSGAAALLVMALTGSLATGGLGAVDAAAAVAAQSRADNAADAIAHAAAGVLAADPDRDAMSVAAQAGSGCDGGVSGVAGASGSPAAADSAAGRACERALAAARQIAAANHAVVLRLTVGPDLRDLRADRGPGRLVTLVLVGVPRGLPVLPAHCPPTPGTGPDLCWAEAWSAAQESG